MKELEEMVVESVKAFEIDSGKKYAITVRYAHDSRNDIYGDMNEQEAEEYHEGIREMLVRLGVPKENIRIIELFDCDVDIKEE